MNDLFTWCVILAMGGMVGFAVGFGVGNQLGRAEGVEAERRWLDRRARIATHERE